MSAGAKATRRPGFTAPAVGRSFGQAYVVDIPYPPSRAEPERHIDTGDHRIDTTARDDAPLGSGTPIGVEDHTNSWWFGAEDVASGKVPADRGFHHDEDPNAGHKHLRHGQPTSTGGARPQPDVPTVSTGTGYEVKGPPVTDSGPSTGIRSDNTRGAMLGPAPFIAGHWTGYRTDIRPFRGAPKNRPRLRAIAARRYELGTTPSPLEGRGPAFNLRTSPFNPLARSRRAGTARPTVTHTQDPVTSADTPPRLADSGMVIGSEWVG
jgi:hypothetical protein